jgi:hypothetical protein
MPGAGVIPQIAGSATPAGSALKKSLSLRKNVTIAENEVSSVISLPAAEHGRPAGGSHPAANADAAQHGIGHPPPQATAPSPMGAPHGVMQPAAHPSHPSGMAAASGQPHPRFQSGDHVPPHGGQLAPAPDALPPGHQYPSRHVPQQYYNQAAPGSAQGMAPPHLAYAQGPIAEGQVYSPQQMLGQMQMQMQMQPGQQMLYAPAQQTALSMNPAVMSGEMSMNYASAPLEAATSGAVSKQGSVLYASEHMLGVVPPQGTQYPQGGPQDLPQVAAGISYIPPEGVQWTPSGPEYSLGQHMHIYHLPGGVDTGAPHDHHGVTVPALDLHTSHPHYPQLPHHLGSPQHHHNPPPQSNQGEVFYPQTNPLTGSPILVPTVSQPWVPPSSYYPGTSQEGSSYMPGAPHGHVSQSLHLGSVLTDDVREIVGVPSEMPSTVGAKDLPKNARTAGNQTSNHASVEELAFRELAAAERKAEEELRLRKSGDIAIAVPSRVDMFNQIFQSTPDTKKIEMIRIHAPHMQSKRVHRGTNTTHDMAVGPAAPMNDVIVSGRSVESQQQQPPPEISTLMNLSSSDILSSRVPPGHPPSNPSSRPPTAPAPVKRPIRPMKEVEVQAIRDALSKALDADACSYLLSEMQHVLTGSSAGGEGRKMGATIVASGGAELPIYDNQAGILLTRSYRTQTPPATFIEILSSSDNPLLYLYEEYAPFLSKMQCTRLLNAAVIEDRVKNDLPTSRSAQVLLGKLLETMMGTVAECTEVMSMLRECEERVHAMVELLHRKPDSLQAIVNSVQMKELFM